MGSTSQLRKVAITNGSLNSIQQSGVPACGEAFKITIRTKNVVFRARLREVTSRFSPAYGNCSVLKVQKWWGLGSTSTETNATSLPGSCSLDASPGGIYDTQQRMLDGVGAHIRRVFWRSTAAYTNPYHSFIPVTSALAYHATAGATSSAIDHNLCVGGLADARALICDGHTPFDAYYGPSGGNEPHVGLTPQSVAFIKREIFINDPVTQLPLRKQLAPTVTTSSSLVCPNATVTLTASSCQPVSSYLWTAQTAGGAPISVFEAPTGGSTSSLSTAGPTVVVYAGSYTGQVIISVVARTNDFADSDPATVTLQTGSPSLSLLVDDDEDTGCGGNFTAHFTATGVGAVSQYHWQVTTTSYPSHNTIDRRVVSSTTTIPTLDAQMPTAQDCRDATLEVKVTVTNLCTGQSMSATEDLRATSGHFDTGPNGQSECISCGVRPAPRPTYDVYPNPVTAGELRIASAAATGSLRVALRDGMGRVCRQASTPQGGILLATSGLPLGLYHLLIEGADGAVDRRIIEVR